MKPSQPTRSSRSRNSGTFVKGDPRCGQKGYQPTAKARAFIEIGFAGGFRIEDVAGALGIDIKTLRRHYPDEVRHSKTTRNIRVVGALYKAAIEGNVTAQIYWTKTQLGWKETSRLEHTGKDGEAITYEERLKQIDESASDA